MKKIGIICSYKDDVVGGQVTKTREFLRAVEQQYGEANVWNYQMIGKNPWKFFSALDKLFRYSEHIIIILASPGYFRILPLLMMINKRYKRYMYEMVIGGIRQNYVTKRKSRIQMESLICKIFVESNHMVNEYHKIGLLNVKCVPNFKNVQSITEIETEKIIHNMSSFRLCTFSRIDKYKGVDVAIEIVKTLREKYQNADMYLDIFGPVSSEYQHEFEELVGNQPEYIQYKGSIDSKNAIEALKNYSCLLCPTKWETEGFPGAFIDALAAGLPVLATRRENFLDIIIDEYNGYLIENNDIEQYVQKVLEWYEDKEKLLRAKKNALKSAKIYQTEYVLENVWEEIEREKKI